MQQNNIQKKGTVSIKTVPYKWKLFVGSHTGEGLLDAVCIYQVFQLVTTGELATVEFGRTTIIV